MTKIFFGRFLRMSDSSNELILRDDGSCPLSEDLLKCYSQGFLTDITLSTEDGKNFEGHRVLLAARSAYFHGVIPRLKADSAIYLKGVKGAHLDKILKFIYGGTCSVSKHQLKPLLEVAKALQVKGNITNITIFIIQVTSEFFKPIRLPILPITNNQPHNFSTQIQQMKGPTHSYLIISPKLP